MKRFGICITLPKDSTMRMPHLLGDNWESYRWYETEAERDQALVELSRRRGYYRVGDDPQLVFSKVEQ